MADSLKAMTVASQVAQGIGGDLEETQRTLNLAFINFRDPSKSAADNIQNLGDVMAYATAKFDYKNVEELRSQLELATPTHCPPAWVSKTWSRPSLISRATV